MQTLGFKMGIPALIAVVVASLIPVVGSLVIAPVIALAVGAVAGRSAALCPHDRSASRYGAHQLAERNAIGWYRHQRLG